MFRASLVGTFVLLGCAQRHDSDDPETPTRSDEEKDLIAVEELAWGYMQARAGEGRLHPIRTAAEYEAYELSQHFPQPPSFDPAAQVLFFVELPNDSGTELRAGVEGIVRTDDRVRVRAYRTKNPQGAMTDNVTRSWVLIRAPKTVLDGDPELILELAPGVR